MGQRANLVIIRNSTTHVFYDHWCANRLDVELFWGPELAASFIQQLAPVNSDAWLDEVWCEGGAVLDEDSHVLTWFGGEDVECDVPLRWTLLDLMQRQWSGWQVRWACGGIVELGSYLGLPADMFLVPQEPDAEFTLLTEYPQDNNALLTVRESGATLATRVCGDEEALEAGSAQLATLLDYPKTRSLDWKGHMPTLGVHVDADARELFSWCANHTILVQQRVAQAWPGWRTTSLQDDFQQHLALADIDVRLPLRDEASLQREVLEHMRRCCNHERRNPAAALANKLGARELSPWTEQTRGSTGEEVHKLHLLDQLQHSLGL